MTIDKEKLKALAEAMLRDEQGAELSGEEVRDFPEAVRSYEAMTAPSAVLALLAEIEGLTAQHGRDSAELRRLCRERDDAKWELNQLKEEFESVLKNYRSLSASTVSLNCSATAMGDEIARLKAENEDYKSGQERYEQIIEDLKAENEALRKDAERYQWLRQGMGKVIVVEPDNAVSCDCDRYEVLLESEVDDAVDADIAKEAAHD